mmetsp:Transcript_29847/g.79699  ORF Transcript_29847/g.79699 Transcript_29847/m.79699 type:complete len:223 (-) Transcript_29847:1188-1856(-)
MARWSFLPTQWEPVSFQLGPGFTCFISSMVVRPASSSSGGSLYSSAAKAWAITPIALIMMPPMPMLRDEEGTIKVWTSSSTCHCDGLGKESRRDVDLRERLAGEGVSGSSSQIRCGVIEAERMGDRRVRERFVSGSISLQHDQGFTLGETTTKRNETKTTSKCSTPSANVILGTSDVFNSPAPRYSTSSLVLPSPPQTEGSRCPTPPCWFGRPRRRRVRAST